MKRLHLFITKLYLGPLIMTFFIAMFVLLMQFLWKYIDDLVGKGLEISVIFELLFYASARLVPMALPLAILVSSIMTFGNLGENNELLAMKSSGISLPRIMFPLIIFSVLISVGAFYFSNNALPYTNLKVGSLLWDIKHQRPELNLKDGVFNRDIEGYVIRIGEKNKHTKMMYNFTIYDHTRGRENTHVSVADSAQMYITPDTTYIILTMYNGINYEEIKTKERSSRKTYPHGRTYFQEQTATLELVGFKFTRTDDELFKNNYQMLNINQLSFSIDSLNSLLLRKEEYFMRNLTRTNYFKKQKHHKIQRNLPRRNDSLMTDTFRGITDTTIRNQFIIQKNDSTRYKRNESVDYDKFMAESVSYEIEDDTINDTSNEHIIIVDLDSLFNGLQPNVQNRIIQNALTYARSTKQYIEQELENHLEQIKYIRKHEVEWYRKFTLSFACFIFFFIGAPFGAIIRKGGLGLPVVVAILLFILYYVLSNVGEKFVKEVVIEPIWGMWLSSAILLPIGAFLTYKASTDSVIMNVETYLHRFLELFKSKKTPITTQVPNANADEQL